MPLDVIVVLAIDLLLTWLVYTVRRRQVEDFRTWILVEGIPIFLVTFVVLFVIWMALGQT